MTDQIVSLNDAVNAHTDWKIELRSAITDGAKLDLRTIERDDCCELGRWLLGAAKQRYGAFPAYREGLSAHSGFHRCAAAVATAINVGEYDKAERMLGTGTAYALASRRLVLAFEALRREIDESGHAPADGDASC